jgi:hypothetical protein
MIEAWTVREFVTHRYLDELAASVRDPGERVVQQRYFIALWQESQSRSPKRGNNDRRTGQPGNR